MNVDHAQYGASHRIVIIACDIFFFVFSWPKTPKCNHIRHNTVSCRIQREIEIYRQSGNHQCSLSCYLCPIRRCCYPFVCCVICESERWIFCLCVCKIRTVACGRQNNWIEKQPKYSPCQPKQSVDWCRLRLECTYVKRI